MTADEKITIESQLLIVLKNLKYIKEAKDKVDGMFEGIADKTHEYTYKYGAINAIIDTASHVALAFAEELNNYITNLNTREYDNE